MKESPKRQNPTPSSILMDDPRYPIWGRLFLCRVPRIAHYSTGYLEQFGLHSSGNRNVDLELAKQPQMVYITINDMIEYFHQSLRISIVKRDDVKIVYESCQDYTFGYAEKLNKTVFGHNAPIQDLVKIDEFAEAVYQHAGHEYGKEFARTFLPEGVMGEIADLNKLFESIDKKVKNSGKKTDTVTIYDTLSPQGAKAAAQAAKRTDELDREQLPARPSMRSLFLSYMDMNGNAR